MSSSVLKVVDARGVSTGNTDSRLIYIDEVRTEDVTSSRVEMFERVALSRGDGRFEERNFEEPCPFIGLVAPLTYAM